MNESKTLKTWDLLAVVLAVGLIMLGANSLWGGIRSEGAILAENVCSCPGAEDVCPSALCTEAYLPDCADSPGEGILVLRRVDWNKGMDTVWGPFDVEALACLDLSEFITNPGDPHLSLFNLAGTHTYTADGSVVDYVCEDTILTYNECTFQNTTPMRCWMTGISESLEGAKGFGDVTITTPSPTFCPAVAAEFPSLQWYTLHLTFPKGPKD